MEHHFNVNVAEKCGMACAVILHNLKYWIEKNKANKKNYHDGHTWVYNSASAFQKLFPYMTKYQITSSLKKLETEGYILTGNYNEMAYDRTTWYTITDEGYALFVENSDTCIVRKPEMDDLKTNNGEIENQSPIPDNKTDINTDNKHYIRASADAPKPSKNKSSKKEDIEKVLNEYTDDEETLSLLHDWLDARKEKRAVNTARAIQINLKKLEGCAKNSGMTVKKYLEEVIARGWAAFYDIKQYGYQSTPRTQGKQNYDETEVPW